ncbi:MAG: GNAT family N-acetyltransferase [Chloroflexi bacterium]|nr:GNAT family N-acetyltransferase [Chloroflexota bacterium]
MSEITVHPIEKLTLNELRPLLDESLVEGYRFLQTLWDEYESGRNRFDRPDARLFGLFDDQYLVGVGGVQRDPYQNRPDVGRVRHVYVLEAYRRQGAGKRLVETLVNYARDHFDLLTLRTQTQAATAFYEAIGFDNQPEVSQATHCLWLKGQHKAR